MTTRLYLTGSCCFVGPENRPDPKKKLVFQPSIFRCYVSLREGIHEGGEHSKRNASYAMTRDNN